MRFVRIFAFIVVCGFAITGISQPTIEEVTVPLDETGISSWKFLSPKTPEPIALDESLVFRNDTASRTFVVTIPFEFRAEDFATAYTTAVVTAPRDQTAAVLTMPEYVSRVLEVPSPNCQSGLATSRLCKLEYLKLLREDVNALKGDGKTIAAIDLGPRALLKPEHLEGLYWTATCNTPVGELARVGISEDDPPALRQQLKIEAQALVGRLLGEQQVVQPFCPFPTANILRDTTLTSRFGNLPDTPTTFDERTRLAARNRFASSRAAIAKNALLVEIDARIDTAYGKGPNSVLQPLDARRQTLEETGGPNLPCELRLLRTAATLLASYGPASKVPFSSPLLDIDPAAACGRGRNTYEESADTARDRIAKERAAQRSGELQNVGFDIVDCKGDGKTTCVARATIPPQQRVVFTRSHLERSGKRVQFTVGFFAEAEPPSNATGYVFLMSDVRANINEDSLPKETLPSQTPETLLFNFVGDAGLDYALPKNGVESHVRRASGGGSLGFQYVGAYDLSATLQFKKGEFGGGTATNQVQATQYQAKVFGPKRTILEYGKFVFARPSSSIAVSEFGEGLRFSFPYGSIGYLVRRESDNPTQTADLADDDSYVVIGQGSVPIPFLRSFLVTGTWGNDEGDAPPADNPDCIRFKLDPTTKEPVMPLVPLTPCNVPRLYATAGFDAKFAIPGSRNMSGSLAAYHSIRNVSKRGTQENLSPTADGEGDVALLTVSWSKLVEQSLLDPLAQAKPSFSLTGYLGYGSADDPASANRDESYLGETAGFANDKLFLSLLAGTKKAIGPGLANKWYTGLQYTNARWSPLKYIAAPLGATDEVQSMTTVITVHKYQFIRDLRCPTFPEDTACKGDALPGARNAGFEVDVDFLIETPKNVRWSLSGGWYRTSRAVEAVGVTKNPWVVLANVSLKFNAR